MPSSVSPKSLLNLLQEHPTAIMIIFVLQEKGLCINSDLIDKRTTQFSDILTGAQGASWKASTLFGGRRPLLKERSSLTGERTTWGWPQGSCQGSGNPPPGSRRWEENSQSLQLLPTRDDAVQVLTPLPTLPAASSPPASLPVPTALSVLAHHSQTCRVPLPTLLSPSLWAILALTSLRC